VTVGVDVPDQSRLVLEAAAVAARERDADLHVLHTWWLPSVYEQVLRERGREEAWQERARAEVQRVVDALSADPDSALAEVSVRVDTRRAHAADALLAAAHDSDLVVVGRHDPLVPLGSHLGPIARAVLRDAECPVMLVDPRASRGRHRAVAAHAGTASA
jgi:nucleotide-binding universal stress UspA family protein